METICKSCVTSHEQHETQSNVKIDYTLHVHSQKHVFFHIPCILHGALGVLIHYGPSYAGEKYYKTMCFSLVLGMFNMC